MNRFITIILGALSCIITAFLNFYIQDLTSINVFSFSVFFVIPVGAILVGMAANSGYYFSALMTNRMLDKYDFFIMVGMATIGLFLIYGIEYYYYVEKEGLSKDITFWQYIALIVENSTFHVKLTKIPLFTNIGSIGAFGYLFLFIHLVGFIIGGATTFLLLFGADKCTKCSKYLQNKKKKVLFFSNQKIFDNYRQKIDGVDPSSNNFKSALFGSPALQFEKVQGSVKYTWKLKKCNSCNTEILNGSAQIYQGKEWSRIKDADKKIIMPLSSNFESQ